MDRDGFLVLGNRVFSRFDIRKIDLFWKENGARIVYDDSDVEYLTAEETEQCRRLFLGNECTESEHPLQGEAGTLVILEGQPSRPWTSRLRAWLGGR
jgi:hypothetical protein